MKSLSPLVKLSLNVAIGAMFLVAFALFVRLAISCPAADSLYSCTVLDEKIHQLEAQQDYATAVKYIDRAYQLGCK